MGLVGTVLLALPVLRLDQLGERLSRLERYTPQSGDDPRWQKLYDELERSARRHKETWSPRNRACLWGGYLLAAGSQLIRLMLTL